MFKTFTAYANALKAAQGKPFLRVGSLYLVPKDIDRLDLRFVKIEIMGPDDRGGSISVSLIDTFSKGYKLPRMEET